MTRKKRGGSDSGLLEVVFILDRSGSMGGKEEDTIGGFNSMMAKQKAESDNIIWSTILFNDGYEIIHDRVPIKRVRPLTEEDYYVGGMTALWDAVGRTVSSIRRAHQIEKGETPRKTLFVITTDGMENASYKYSHQRLERMIKEQQEKQGWEFLFLGSNIDSVREGRRFGVSGKKCIDYLDDTQGIEKSYEALGDVLSDMASMQDLNLDCFESLREDYERRSKGRPAD